MMSDDDPNRVRTDPLREYFDDRIMGDPTVPQSVKTDLFNVISSHLRRGEVLRFRGFPREALQEFAKEIARSINSDIDAEIVETAFWQMGNVYRELGEIVEAITAFEKARELVQQYRVGTWPHEDLAELYLQQNQIDEAIAVCEECLKEFDSWRSKQLLAKAVALKAEGAEQSDD